MNAVAENLTVALALEADRRARDEDGMIESREIVGAGSRARIAIIALPVEAGGVVEIPADAVFVEWEDRLQITEASRTLRPGDDAHPATQVRRVMGVDPGHPDGDRSVEIPR